MILKGQKRKLLGEDVEAGGGGGPAWERQRQFVFSVSMNKYQRGQQLAEPSLRRSVLIANTLRQVSHTPGGGPPRPPPQEDVAMSEDDEDWGAMSADSSLSAAIASILTALDSPGDGAPPPPPRTPLRALENLPPQGRQGEGPGCLGDVTVEDLFQDIDTSLLERDMGGLGLMGGGGGHPAGGLGLIGGGGGHPAGEDLLRYLPPFSSPSLKLLPSFSSFSPLAPPSGQELEQLMEILVES